MNDYERAKAGLPPLHTPNLPAARAARDDGIALVAKNAGEQWRDHALRLLRQFLHGAPDFILQDFRLWAERRGLGEPHHPNAWGSLLPTAAKRGWVKITDATRQTQFVDSHARRSMVWVSLITEAPQWNPPESPQQAKLPY